MVFKFALAVLYLRNERESLGHNAVISIRSISICAKVDDLECH